MGEIEDSNSDMFDNVQAWKFELLDAAGIDDDSLVAIRESDAKVELVFQWIQQLIVENITQISGEERKGVLDIPPPILSRTFQELANGIVAYNDAIKVSSIPFPFPYAQTCD